jgi:hypothetical protein
VSGQLRLVVLGMMGRVPFAGQTWLYLNWLLGLRSLGHDVYYIEDDTVWPYDPVANTITDDCSYAVNHISACMQRIGMADRWAFRLADGAGTCAGRSESQLHELYRSCDALLNVVGATDLRDEHLEAPRRILVQTDPVTAELRLAGGDRHTREAFSMHDTIVTYGENYGAADCGVPLDPSLDYRKTRQPIALDFWPMAYTPAAAHFTTIGNYRQDGEDVSYDGNTYSWSKHHEWEKLIELPRRTSQTFELASMPDLESDRMLLQRHGWRLTAPIPMSLDIFGAYPAYIRGSRAELTVAKDQNVRLRSGWFSERDVCYLASGKPVIAQDTGFSNVLPTGDGLFAFSTIDEALGAVEAVNGDYHHHCEAARAIAAEHFEAGSVARRLLETVGLG